MRIAKKIKFSILFVFIIGLSSCSAPITKEVWEKNPEVIKYESKLFKIYDNPIIDKNNKEWDVKFWFSFSYFTDENKLRCLNGLSTPYSTILKNIVFTVYDKDGLEKQYNIKPILDRRDDATDMTFYRRSTVIQKRYLEYYKYKLEINFIKDIGQAEKIEFVLSDGRKINEKVQIDQDILDDFKEIFKAFLKDGLIKK